MAELTFLPLRPEVQDPHDLTPFVERVEKMEDLCGVRIGAISAQFLQVDADGEYVVKIMAELTGAAGIGHVLDSTVVVQCVAYDADGRMVAQASECLWQHNFRGLHALDVQLYCIREPVRFTIFPRK